MTQVDTRPIKPFENLHLMMGIFGVSKFSDPGGGINTNTLIAFLLYHAFILGNHGPKNNKKAKLRDFMHTYTKKGNGAGRLRPSRTPTVPRNPNPLIIAFNSVCFSLFSLEFYVTQRTRQGSNSRQKIFID